MDASSSPQVLHSFLLPAKIGLMASAVYPYYICYNKWIEAWGDSLKPNIDTVFPMISPTPRKSLQVRAFLGWSALLVVGLISFVVNISDVGFAFLK